MQTFCKYHGLKNDSLIKEVYNLNLLNGALQTADITELKLPKIISYSNEEIIMEKIDTKEATKIQMASLGENLARLHKIKYDDYGYDVDNFIGLGIQKNTLSKNWGEFFLEYRLLFQISLIKDETIKEKFESIIKKNQNKIINFLNENTAHASIVHGDLWCGNVLFDTKSVYLIDPASYFADREVDIAMTKLFGGFSEEFYKSYNETYPLSNNFKKKQIIYNLYHYLNHYNLFGISYLNSSLVSLQFIEEFQA